MEGDRFNPSMEALQEVEHLKTIAETDSEVTEPEVVWLPHGLAELDEDYDEDSGEACEAVRFLLDGTYCYKAF